MFLGGFADLWKATISSVMVVRHSVRRSVRQFAWSNSVPTGRIFMKFDI
jgi:hypothetical protein